MKEAPEAVARKLYKNKFPDSNCILLAGSVVRGEATEFSDLDIIVLYDQIENAYRDSLIYEGWPVEIFVHDLSTVKYFFEDDAKSGVPSLQSMIDESIAIPEKTPLAQKAKDLAKASLEKGPPPPSQERIDQMRYTLTDLMDDLKDPKSNQEALATGTQVYGRLAELYFVSRGEWSARGKHIPRKLAKLNVGFCNEFNEAFEKLFCKGDAQPVIQLIQRTLEPRGGELFAGHKLEAPKDWRQH